MTAWRRSLAAIGADLTGAVLLAAANGSSLARGAVAPVREEGMALVTLGAGDVPSLPDDASPRATGAPDASFDAVVMLAAWDGPHAMYDVAAEAARIVRPGCHVWLGDIDAEAMVESTPAAYPQAILYREHPEVGDRLLSAHEGSSRMALAALGSGIRPLLIEAADLPLGAYTDASAYVEAVRSGLWPGSEWIGAQQMDDVLVALQQRLREVEFPTVAHQPWLLVHGPRSR